MDQYEFIRTAHRVYGKNITELARQTGHSRNTIKKAIRGEPWGYKDRETQSSPVLGPFQMIINGWLTEDTNNQRNSDIPVGEFLTVWWPSMDLQAANLPSAAISGSGR